MPTDYCETCNVPRPLCICSSDQSPPSSALASPDRSNLLTFSPPTQLNSSQLASGKRLEQSSPLSSPKLGSFSPNSRISQPPNLARSGYRSPTSAPSHSYVRPEVMISPKPSSASLPLAPPEIPLPFPPESSIFVNDKIACTVSTQTEREFFRPNSFYKGPLAQISQLPEPVATSAASFADRTTQVNEYLLSASAAIYKLPDHCPLLHLMFACNVEFLEVWQHILNGLNNLAHQLKAESQLFKLRQLFEDTHSPLIAFLRHYNSPRITLYSRGSPRFYFPGSSSGSSSPSIHEASKGKPFLLPPEQKSWLINCINGIMQLLTTLNINIKEHYADNPQYSDFLKNKRREYYDEFKKLSGKLKDDPDAQKLCPYLKTFS